jgi:hypothetical protein
VRDDCFRIRIISRKGAKAQSSRESKSEIRSTKSETNRSQINPKLGKFKTSIPAASVWNIEFVLSFVVLNLFRISRFGFRAFPFGHLNLFRASNFIRVASVLQHSLLLTLHPLP